MKLFVSHLIAENIEHKPTPRHIIVDSLDLDMPVLISNGLKKFRLTNNEEKKEAPKLWMILGIKCIINNYRRLK